MKIYKFSLIIPSYNCSNTIVRTLDSIYKQNYSDFEVIVVDDRSSDNTSEVILNFIKSNNTNNLTLISNLSNSGPAVSRNNGIDIAKGEYICFVDSDDYVSSEYFYTLHNIIDSDNPDLIYFGCTQIIGRKTNVSGNMTITNNDDLTALSSGALWRYAYKTDLLREFPLPNIRNAEDIAIIPLVLQFSNKTIICNKSIYYYINNNNSLSNTHSPDVTYNFIKSFDYTLSFLNPPYSDGIVFHGIKTILYGAVLNGLKANMAKRELNAIIDSFKEKFPNWTNNKYIPSYSSRKRLFLSLIRHRNFFLMRLYVKVHTLLLKYL